jgi:hypothetical protein
MTSGERVIGHSSDLSCCRRRSNSRDVVIVSRLSSVCEVDIVRDCRSHLVGQKLRQDWRLSVLLYSVLNKPIAKRTLAELLRTYLSVILLDWIHAKTYPPLVVWEIIIKRLSLLIEVLGSQVVLSANGPASRLQLVAHFVVDLGAYLFFTVETILSIQNVVCN